MKRMIYKFTVLPVLLVLSLNVSGQTSEKITLEKALKIALENNHSLKASAQQVQIARGNYKENFFLRSPEVGANFDQVPRGESVSESQERSYYIEQTFDFPLKYHYRNRTFRAGITSAELSYRQAELSLKAQTRNSYLSWLGSISKLQVAKENLEISEQFLAASEKLNQQGEIGSIPVSQARMGLLQSKLQNNNAINLELKSRAALLTVLGLPADTRLAPQDSLLQYSNLLMVQASFDTINQVNLQYLNSVMQQAQTNLTLQRTAYLPDFRVSYSRQRITDSRHVSGGAANGTPGFYGLGVGVTVPLWFFTQQGSIQRVKAQTIQTRENYNQARLGMDNQWRSILNSMKQYQENIESYQKLTEESLKLIADAQKAYELGELSYLEFLAAKQSYLDAKNNYLDNLLNYQLTITEYHTLTGGF